MLLAYARHVLLTCLSWVVFVPLLHVPHTVRSFVSCAGFSPAGLLGGFVPSFYVLFPCLPGELLVPPFRVFPAGLLAALLCLCLHVMCSLACLVVV